MVQVSRPADPASPVTFASLRWWGPALAICVLCLGAGAVELIINGRVAEAVVQFAIVVIAGSFAIQARKEFRRGWRYGYESAARVLVENAAGRVSDVEARAAFHGDPTPEPWEPHNPLRSVRSVR